MRKRFAVLAAAVLGAGAALCSAGNILSPGDAIIAIDNNFNIKPSSLFPGAEDPAKAVDGNDATKYLSFGREMTGFIVTPTGGSSSVQSLQITTANDSQERDPATILLYGRNGAVSTVNGGTGLEDPWVFIQKVPLSLPAARGDTTTVVNVTNANSYDNYKVLVQTLKLTGNPNSMQVAEIRMFNAAGGTGTNVALTSPVIGIDQSDSAYPPTERPLEAIDGIKTSGSKYLNFGREGTGLIVTPAAGSTVVRGIRLTTANDTVERDPSAYELYGTNDAITSLEHSDGAAENWTLISSGGITLPAGRNVEGDIIDFANANGYTSYKIVFTENKGPDGAANSIQFAELELLDVAGIPEPTTLSLLGFGMMVVGMRRRK